jgi:hypothetical protein
MEPKEILEQIEQAGAWLPLTTVRQAFSHSQSLIPAFLKAVEARAAGSSAEEVPAQRRAAFGLFFLAQHREPRLLAPLVRLFETVDPWQQDEWLFAGRLFFFGHRLIAGVCPLELWRPLELACNATLKPLTRSAALCAIGLHAASGDITRTEAVCQLRKLFRTVRAGRDVDMDACWARTAVKVHSRDLQRELEWFLASGRLDRDCRRIIAGAIQNDPDSNFISITALDPMVDLFTNVFPHDIRDGEAGLLPNGQIPGLEFFMEREPSPTRN